MRPNRDFNNFDPDDDDDELIDTLRDNIGRVITVFTQSGGCSGRGFTGLLISVNCRSIRMITSLPSAPQHPFGRSGNRGRCGCHNRSRFGTSIIIPIRKIVSCVFNDQ